MDKFETTCTAVDGIKLYAQGWRPEGEPKAVVCLIHGLGEHCGRYAHVAESLEQAGYAMLGFDLRGHGKSDGKRGHTPSTETYLQDIDRLLEEAEKWFPGAPRFLYGHSLGGILVLNYALNRDADLAGVIATGPVLRTSLEEQTGKVFLAKTFATLLPSFDMPSGLNPQDISRDPEIVQTYIEDPLVHDRATLAFAKSSLQAIEQTFEKAVDFPVPLLLMHGTSDRLGFPSGSQEFAGLVRCDCTLKLWEGLAHEIHNEPEKEEVLQFMVGWLDSKIRV